MNNIMNNITKVAQFMHDFRVIPRSVVMGYALLVWDVVQWFQGLPAPSTQQTVLLTTIIGFSAAIFGFYTTTVSGLQKK